LTCRYGASGTERRKVIKHAFKVIFDNIIPDVHKLFIHHNKFRKTVPREEITQKMKKLKVTKKAQNELEGEEKLFYELLVTMDLDKDQKKKSNILLNELDCISEQYKK
jgi:hypothetical protein